MFAYKPEGSNIPIMAWLNKKDYFADAGLVSQTENLSKHPIAFHHIALMPDAHLGYGMPIGGVMATKGGVIPNAVGVDIGCGMCAISTNLTIDDLNMELLKTIIGTIRKEIPVGHKHHKHAQENVLFDNHPDIEIINNEMKSAKKQLGTLGGGNHFIEFQSDQDGKIWVMIHSGSRNFGLKIASTYHDMAKKLCEKWYSNIPHQDLAFLPTDTKEAHEYLEAMNYALEFAFESRKHMMFKTIEIINNNIGCEFDDMINIHHNYASMENHFSSNVLIHRKGATLARDGIGIIPGSQGTSSYIVKGLNNDKSFTSCSHGAGRIMGRNEAKKKLNMDDEIAKMDGILHSIRGKDDLDEAPGAYKNIDDVINLEKDLIEITVSLKPLAVIKG